MKYSIERRLGRLVVLLTAVIVATGLTRAWAAGPEVGTFTSPLITTWGGSGVSAPTAHGVLVAEGASAFSPKTMTNGQLLIGSTGADPVPAAITDGTGISHSTGAGTLTITNAGVTSVAAGLGISVSGSTGAVTISTTGGGSLAVTAKTSNYSVLSGDAGTYFTNTGASGEVDFTLPTAASGLQYFFYTDAVQTVKVIAGSSTTIQMGGTTSASAGNVLNAVQGNCIHLVAISTTQWVAISYTGTWTVN